VFKANLGYIARLSQKTKQNKQIPSGKTPNNNSVFFFLSRKQSKGVEGCHMNGKCY
jgi:hypothetical protein